MLDFGGEMMWFGQRFPQEAASETLGVTVEANEAGIKPGRYGFLELYCTDNTCDCQRAMIRVYDDDLVLHATLSYGWRDLKFYVDWMHGDVATAATIPGINLYTLQPQSNNADAFLAIFRDLLRDETVAMRFQQHYQLFKATSAMASPRKGLTPVEVTAQSKKRRRLNLKAKSCFSNGSRLLPPPRP
jgi:hypothetical protein